MAKLKQLAKHSKSSKIKVTHDNQAKDNHYFFFLTALCMKRYCSFSETLLYIVPSSQADFVDLSLLCFCLKNFLQTVQDEFAAKSVW